MSRIQKKRPEPVSRPAGKSEELAHSVRRQIAFAAGAEFFQHRDPLYHVTESFQQAFDAIGRAKAPKDAGSGDGGSQETEQGENSNAPGSAKGVYEDDRERNMLRCFSDNAFQRGLLSGAVLRGTGKMMLISCLKKTAGQLEPENLHQRKLFERGGAGRRASGGSPDRVVFNRGFAKSAVGLVVDVLFDARRVVEDMRALIEKGGDEGGDTLRAMYPFLDDRRERQLLEQYYARIKNPEGLTSDERAILQAAIEKTEALKARKAQMKQELIDRLRYISGMAAKAIEELTDPEFIPEETAGEKKPILPIIPIIPITDRNDHDDEEEDGAGGQEGGGAEESIDAPGAREDSGSAEPEEEPLDPAGVPPDGPDDKAKRRRRTFFIPIIVDGEEDEEENRDDSAKDPEPESANLGEGEHGTADPEPGPADPADRSGDAEDTGL